jgi:hypothetical protein
LRARAAALAPLVVAAIGCLGLTALTIAKIPLADWRRQPETPFDLTSAGEAVQLHLFLSSAAPHIPEGASVAFVSRPDPARDEPWRKFGRALLPGRRIVPRGTYADYAIVADYLAAGAAEPAPPVPGAGLVYQTPYGTVWKLPR